MRGGLSETGFAKSRNCQTLNSKSIVFLNYSKKKKFFFFQTQFTSFLCKPCHIKGQLQSSLIETVIGGINILSIIRSVVVKSLSGLHMSAQRLSQERDGII